MNRNVLLASAIVMGGLTVAACGSASSNGSTPTTTSGASGASTSTTGASASTTAGSASTTSATCPTLAQAEAKLGATFGGPVQHAAPAGGIVCEYTSSSPTSNAGVTIFTHQNAAVFAGQVAHAPGDPAMPALSGVGDGAYGQSVGGRSIVNAYSRGTRTIVAAQSAGTLAQTEALAKVALSDN